MAFKRLLPACVALLILLGGAVAVQADQGPKDRIEEGVQRLIEILSDPIMQDESRHHEAIGKLRDAAEEYIDFDMVTKYAVGRPWLDMTPVMRKDITEAFIKLLERSYLKRIPAYDGQEINYFNELVQGDKAKVQAEVIDGDKKFNVEFRLRIINKKWMIYDIVAEGVSLVMNYRSQFSEVLNDGKPEDLLRLLNERIAIIDEKNATEE